MRIFILLLILPFYSSLSAQQKEIGESLHQANVEALGKYFNTSIELAMPHLEGVYNKKQAQIVLTEFFSKNEVIQYEFKHKGGGKSKASFEIGSLQTKKGNFRCYILYNLLENKPQIIEFRIDKE